MDPNCSQHSYDENGNCKGTPEFTPPTPTRITWELTEAGCAAAIEDAHMVSQKLLNVSLTFLNAL